MNVLYCASEAYPFAASGGLADVAGSLPRALRRRRVACRAVLPLYKSIDPQYRQAMKFLCSFEVPLAWRRQYCGVFQLNHDGVIYYFLDNEYYFGRPGLYGYYDDGERFAFFSRAILEMLAHIDFAPDILHLNDWQSALAAVYLNRFYRQDPKFYAVKTIFTIHNVQYQGHYGPEMLDDVLGLPPEDRGLLEYDGGVNYMKAAILASDRVTTVSPTYARELADPWFAHGMDPVIRDNAFKLRGIVNGLDADQYNPAHDPALPVGYDTAGAEAGKAACKADLQAEMGLSAQGRPLLFGVVSRLVEAKGIDLVCQVAEHLIMSGAQLVVLGSGDSRYEESLRALAARYPGRAAVTVGFVPALARRIYAGADCFLMPSKQEPCGLSQLIALRYGTLPVVRLTGGLADTVRDAGDGAGNGFTFADYNASALLDACLRAKAAFEGPDWPALVRRAMATDSSWGASAVQYIALYNETTALWG